MGPTYSQFRFVFAQHYGNSWDFVFGPCFVMQYFVPVLVLQIILQRKREPIVSLITYGCKCSMSLLQGAVVWSAVYDCGIFWSYSFCHFIIK